MEIRADWARRIQLIGESGNFIHNEEIRVTQTICAINMVFFNVLRPMAYALWQPLISFLHRLFHRLTLRWLRRIAGPDRARPYHPPMPVSAPSGRIARELAVRS